MHELSREATRARRGEARDLPHLSRATRHRDAADVHLVSRAAHRAPRFADREECVRDVSSAAPHGSRHQVPRLRVMSLDPAAPRLDDVRRLPRPPRTEASARGIAVREVPRPEGRIDGGLGPRRVHRLSRAGRARAREAATLVRDVPYRASNTGCDQPRPRSVHVVSSQRDARTGDSAACVRELSRARGNHRAARTSGVRDVSRAAQRREDRDLRDLPCGSSEARARYAGLRDMPPPARTQRRCQATRVRELSPAGKAARTARGQGPRGVLELSSLPRASAAG